MLLSIDSSAGASAAVLGPQGILSARRTPQTNTHAEWLAPAVQAVLQEAGLSGRQLSGLVVGVGPGPFTGLRVGLALGHSLAQGWGLSLHGVCSLDALAYRLIDVGGAHTPEEFVVVTDARRREVYWARYRADHGVPMLLEGPHVSPAEHVPKLPAVGAGVGLYPEQFSALSLPPTSPGTAECEDVSTWLPDAADLACVANLAESVAGSLAEPLAGSAAASVGGSAVLRDPYPLYLRESDAQVPQQVRGHGDHGPEQISAQEPPKGSPTHG